MIVIMQLIALLPGTIFATQCMPVATSKLRFMCPDMGVLPSGKLPAIIAFHRALKGNDLKGILAAPPKATPTRNKGLIRPY